MDTIPNSECFKRSFNVISVEVKSKPKGLIGLLFVELNDTVLCHLLNKQQNSALKHNICGKEYNDGLVWSGQRPEQIKRKYFNERGRYEGIYLLKLIVFICTTILRNCEFKWNELNYIKTLLINATQKDKKKKNNTKDEEKGLQTAFIYWLINEMKRRAPQWRGYGVRKIKENFSGHCK